MPKGRHAQTTHILARTCLVKNNNGIDYN